MEEKLNKFQKSYTIFIENPITLNSNKFKELRPEFELIEDTLSGPLLNIYERGNINYAIKNKKQPFRELTSKKDFLKWCSSILDEYRDKIQEIEIQNDNERNDKLFLVNRLKLLEELCKEADLLLQ